MKIAVIVSDATSMMHTGADLSRMVRVFELPDEIAAYIKANTQYATYTTVSFAAVDEDQP